MVFGMNFAYYAKGESFLDKLGDRRQRGNPWVEEVDDEKFSGHIRRSH